MMKDDDTAFTVIFTILILSLASVFWFNFGARIGNNEGRDKTVVLCVEKPEQCKERYKFLKLREKLGE